MHNMREAIIRSARIDDATRLTEIYKYYVDETAISFEYEAPTVEEFAGRMKNIMAKYPYLVAEYEGKIIGYSYANTFKDRTAYDRSVELTIYLDKDYKGIGAGRILYEALEAELKKRGILNLYACICDPEVEDEYVDKNSTHFHEHLGFVTCGTFHKCGYKFDRWYDMIWMEKMIGEHA